MKGLYLNGKPLQLISNVKMV